MNINKDNYNLSDHPDLKIKMLNWANRFSIFCLLDNNGYGPEDPAFECLLGAGCTRSFCFSEENNFSSFQSFFDASPSWLFGHLGYNAAGNAYVTDKKEEPDFGRGFFFEPEIILRLAAGKIEILKSNVPAEILIQQIHACSGTVNDTGIIGDVSSETSRDEYLQDIKKLQGHIHRGDCYEINYCLQFFAENTCIDPISVYVKLAAVSPAPFGAFYKLNDKYCLCASPERFLKKTGRQLLSQPIKGTAKRNHIDPENDKLNKENLQRSAKDKSENVMIVDLVRNDLSTVCEKDSVTVTELFGIYSFPQVHQMISSIEGTLEAGKNFTNAIEACFPPGSMTGAPKYKVMELIENYEAHQRGLFSGSIGYIKPCGDFDFNVVIRSIFYNKATKILSFAAGSGITFYSNDEEEYEECLAKTEGILRTLNPDGS